MVSSPRSAESAPLRLPEPIGTDVDSSSSTLIGSIASTLVGSSFSALMGSSSPRSPSSPEEVRWEIEDILMEKNVSYVVFAYFDVGVPDVDSATGNQIVNVALTVAEITRLGDSDPVSLGTISGVQMRGQGSSNDIAKNNAINLVSKKTAQKLVALINSKGIN